MKTLRDLLPFVSYTATLVLMETERGRRDYEYMFGTTELIRRDVIEKCYPELLDRELSDGVHGEGTRDGLYIHLYK
jgi:hypothetical protein